MRYQKEGARLYSCHTYEDYICGRERECTCIFVNARESLWDCVCLCVYVYMCIRKCIFVNARENDSCIQRISAMIRRLLKILGLFCRISSLLQGSFAKKREWQVNTRENWVRFRTYPSKCAEFSEILNQFSAFERWIQNLRCEYEREFMAVSTGIVI